MKLTLGNTAKRNFFTPVVHTFTTPGGHSVTVPEGALQAVVDCYSSSSNYHTDFKTFNGGGNGGNFARKTLSVTAGQTLNIVVADAPASINGAGINTYVTRDGDYVCLAVGAGSPSGANFSLGSIGDLIRTGGNGHSTGVYGHGGGCAGPDSNGGNGNASTSGGLGGGGLAGVGGVETDSATVRSSTNYGGGPGKRPAGGSPPRSGAVQITFS